MSSWRSIVGSAAASWIALTVAATAQSKDEWQLPTGDVWITPDHPYLFHAQPKPKTSPIGTAIGDVWMAPDQDERSASESQEGAKEPLTSKK
jgi:hypothetical protein